METSERLELIKQKIKEKAKNNIVEELQVLNKSFNDLKYIITGSEKVQAVADSKEIIELVKLMNERLDKLIDRKDFSITNLKEIPKPQLMMPKEIEISNIEKAKTDKVKITNWQDMPKPAKPKDVQEVEIKGFKEALEKIISQGDEIPNAVDFAYTFDRKWKLIRVLYSKTLLNIKILREANGDITRLEFEAVSQGQ